MSEDEGYIARELKKYNRKELGALRIFTTILFGMIGLGAVGAIFSSSGAYPGYSGDSSEGIFKVVIAGVTLLFCIGMPQLWFMGGNDEVEAMQPMTFDFPPITRKGRDDDDGGGGRGHHGGDDGGTGNRPKRQREQEGRNSHSDPWAGDESPEESVEEEIPVHKAERSGQRVIPEDDRWVSRSNESDSPELKQKLQQSRLKAAKSLSPGIKSSYKPDSYHSDDMSYTTERPKRKRKGYDSK